MPVEANEIFTDSNGRKFFKDFFFYRARIDSLASGASSTVVVSIEANSDFVWLKSSYNCSIAGAAYTESSRPIPLIDVTITDSGSGRNLQSSAIPLSSIAGHEGLPFNLPVPRIFQRNSNVTFTFTNNDAAVTYVNTTLTLAGYKKFYL